MKSLPDERYVAEVSIPGAHDAATGSGWRGLYGPIGNRFARTQDLDLQQLWDVGVRAFDLRPAVYRYHMNLNHGMVPTRLHLEDVLATMKEWLKANPSEFIIIHLLHAADGDQCDDDYGKRLTELLARPEWKGLMADFKVGLRVREMRGKILILSRNNYSARPVGGIFEGWTGGLDWHRQTSGHIRGSGGQMGRMCVQDFSSTYHEGGIEAKVKGLTRMLDFSMSHRAGNDDNRTVWVLNFLSAYSKVMRLLGHDISRSNGYRDNAVHTHAAMLEYLKIHQAGPTGIVMMDYAGVDRSKGYEVKGMELVRTIIDTNFR